MQYESVWHIWHWYMLFHQQYPIAVDSCRRGTSLDLFSTPSRPKSRTFFGHEAWDIGAVSCFELSNSPHLSTSSTSVSPVKPFKPFNWSTEGTDMNQRIITYHNGCSYGSTNGSSSCWGSKMQLGSKAPMPPDCTRLARPLAKSSFHGPLGTMSQHERHGRMAWLGLAL